MPVASFAKCRTRRDGLSDRCRACEAARYQRDKAKRQEYFKSYYIKNKARIIARVARWERDNPERNRRNRKLCYERRKEKIRAYRADNRKRLNATIRNWKHLHREHVNASERRRRLANLVQERLRKRESEGRRRAQMRATERAPVDYASIIARDGLVCHICGEPVEPGDVHFDHVVPLARGGAHVAANISVSHSTCNLRKGARLPSD